MNPRSRFLDPVFVLRGSSGLTCVHHGHRRTGNVLFSGSADGLITIWSIKQNRSLKAFPNHQENTENTWSVLGIAQLEDGTLLSHGRDGEIVHWNLDSSQESIIRKISVYSLGFCSFSVVKTVVNHWVGFQANADSQVDVICLENPSEILHLTSTEKLGMVMQIKLFSDMENKNTYALIGYEDGSVALWDVEKQQVLHKLKLFNDPIMCLDLDSRNLKAATGSADDQLVQFSIDIKPGIYLHEIRSLQLKSKGLSAIKVRGDCKIVAVGCWDGSVRIFAWKKLKPLAILKYHAEAINCLDFSKDNILACGSKDGKISLWDVYGEK